MSEPSPEVAELATVARGLAEVRAAIAAACARGGRSPTEVTVVAVTKRHPARLIEVAQTLGLGDVGENYVQELVAKQEELRGHPGLEALRWHYIGKLQRNKVKDLVGRVCLLHAIDSIALLDEIDKRAGAAGLRQEVLVAVSLAGEAQKSGVAPAQLADLLAHGEGLSRVSIRGLMTMPPLAAAAEASRPYFRALRELRDRHGGADRLPLLSMGTTGDFPVAVEEGATLVRVGTALFGERAT